MKALYLKTRIGAVGWLCLFVAVLMVASLPLTARADLYNIQKDPTLYGNLDQDDIPQGGQYMCGPTAAVNSFIYLQNAYPATYDTSLVPMGSAGGLDLDGNNIPGEYYDDMIAVAQTVGSPVNMNTLPVLQGGGCGTWDDMFIYGKSNYIESVLPNKTIYAAQLKSQWAWAGRPVPETPPIAKPLWVQDLTQPDGIFLFNELNDCEDVEILIVDGDWGHYLTVTGLVWNDGNGDQLIQGAENASVLYIDPVTGLPGVSPIGGQTIPGDPIRVSYGAFPQAELVMTVSESPIPEPMTLSLLALGALAVLRKRK